MTNEIKTPMLTQIPENLPTAQQIFICLAAGKFSPMSADFRHGAAGAGPDARTLDVDGFTVIADCQEGEGLHFEIWDKLGNVWGIDASSGKLDLLLAGEVPAEAGSA